jgi:alpha-1,3-rhamnosyltransferase
MNSQDSPLVTVVIPIYNHERYVSESIQSIVNQTYRNIEMIVINDGSKDDSHGRVLSLAKTCKQRFVRFEYIYRQNIGLSATLNQALSMAKGKYFTALASDDVALPEKIELLVNALEASGPACAASFGNALFIDNKGRKVRLDSKGRIVENQNSGTYSNFLEYYLRRRSFDYMGPEFGTYRTLIDGNYLPAMSNIVRTAAISEVGGWTAGNLIEDWEMWLKLSKRYSFVYVDVPVASYRWHEDNTVKAGGGVPAIYSSLSIVEREKKYCKENNMLSLWNRSHNRLTYALLRNGKFTFAERWSILRKTDKAQLLIFTMCLVARNAMRKIYDRANSATKRDGFVRA